MQLHTWKAQLERVDTGETLREMEVLTGRKCQQTAFEKCLYAWGLGHSVLIGTRIRLSYSGKSIR
jgi:hypothetical protein